MISIVSLRLLFSSMYNFFIGDLCFSQSKVPYLDRREPPLGGWFDEEAWVTTGSTLSDSAFPTSRIVDGFGAAEVYVGHRSSTG